MNPEDIILGKEYILKSDYDYWCIELQRNIRICPGQEMVVKINQTHLNQVFFGTLIDSQGELEFGPDAVLSEYKAQEKPSSLIHFFIPNALQ